jgi:uncharacterized membrane-anchored protein YjiN (DUF445 family)
MKRRATGLLVVVTAAFVVVIVVTEDQGWASYTRAALEASMVGGLADWFAVTALFRHPLGLPIPHTAVIVERKDQFGATMGGFVQEQFLSAENVAERVRAVGVASRLGNWLADEANADKVARHTAELMVRLADAVRDEDVHRVLEEEVRRRVEDVAVAPLAGRALRTATAEGRHRELVDAILRGLARFLDENEESLRAQFRDAAPWWLPGAVDDRIFERLLDGVQAILRDDGGPTGQDLRARIDARLADIADQLEHSPEWREQGERLKRELLAQPEFRRWTASVWADVKTTLRTQAGDPTSEVRRRLTSAIAAGGRRLRDDESLARTVNEMAEAGVRALAEQFRDDVTALVSGTIARWDARETALRLELLLGRDLQFIRINGTVVGGLAGVAIHGVADLIG